jgi:predicted nucleic acid-binding protein
VTGVVFDTAALIAIDRGNREIAVLVAEARKGRDTITVPASVLAQAWRNPARQARLAAFLRLPNVDVVALDAVEARLIGLLLAAARRGDVVDAHVAVCALRRDQPVVTSDPGDLEHLAPSLRMHVV